MKNARLIILILFVSFFLNFAWEFLQAPLYECFKNSLEENYGHYLMAIAGDSMYTIIIYLLVSIRNKDLGWGENSYNNRNIMLSVIIGLILAIFIEYKGVYILGKWNYSPLMPTLFGIGIVPLLQMMILPILSFKIANMLNTHKQKDN